MTPIASQPPPKLPLWLEQLDAVRPSMASTSIGTEIAHSVGAFPHGAIEHFTEREPTGFCHRGTSENSHARRPALITESESLLRRGGGRGVRRRLTDALPDSDERELMEPRQVLPGSARALVGGVPANARDLSRCPICGEPLKPRQRVCSGRCRAELSRRRQAQARQARDEQVRALLLAALALMGKNEQP